MSAHVSVCVREDAALRGYARVSDDGEASGWLYVGDDGHTSLWGSPAALSRLAVALLEAANAAERLAAQGTGVDVPIKLAERIAGMPEQPQTLAGASGTG